MAAISFGLRSGYGMTNGFPLSRLSAAFNKASVYAFISLTLSRLGAPCTRDCGLYTFIATGCLTLSARFFADSTMSFTFRTLTGALAFF